ncbi:MAG: helix-turn-helix domain-containing protein [Patescibacteria group bacterium]|nr:helix-turn-helix domain-containing protein [Patescibacteria group bacterium]
MLLKDLQKLGFTKNLATVYTTLFELGEAKAGNIVRSTGMHRNLVYLALEELEEKKLVSKSQTRGVARFNVLDPTRLLGEVEEKKKLAEDIIDELKSKHKIQSQEIIIYEGLAEMQKKMLSIYESMEEGDHMNILGGTSSSWFEAMGEKNINKFLKIQEQRKFFINLIGGELDENEQKLKNKLGDFINYKIIPNVFSKTNETNILKDRVILLIFVEPFTTVEIINPAVAESFKKYFDILWDDTTQNLRGKDGVRMFFDEISNVQDVYWIGGSKDGMDNYFPELARECKKTRLEKKINWYDLLDPEADLAGVEKDSNLNDEPYYHYKYLSASVSSPHVICIYGNKVANIIWKDGGFINIIENEEIAKGYMKQFDYLWNQDVVVETGFDALHRCFYNMLEELEKEDEYFVLGASLGNNSTKIKKFYDQFHKDRIKKGVKNSMLVYKDSYDLIKKRFEMAGDQDFKISKLKKFSTILPIPMQINLYRGKTSFILYGDVPTIIYFDKKEIFDSFKGYFDYLWNQDVQTYSGKEEVYNLFNKIILDQLHSNDSEYVIGAGYGDEVTDDYVTKLFKIHNSYLIKNNIHKHVLMYEKHRDKFEKEVKKFGDKKFEYVHVRYLPDTYAFPVETHIYNDMATITYFGENPVSTVYTHSKIIENYKKQFDLLWNVAKE